MGPGGEVLVHSGGHDVCRAWVRREAGTSRRGGIEVAPGCEAFFAGFAFLECPEEDCFASEGLVGGFRAEDFLEHGYLVDVLPCCGWGW